MLSMEKIIGERFMINGKLIEVMESFNGCLGCCCPLGECFDWHCTVSECMPGRRIDGKSVIFHHVPRWWGVR